MQDSEAQLIQMTEIILWDECPMMHRHNFEALDRTFRDIMGQINPLYKTIPFGNLVVALGGDLRQVLAVVKRGIPKDIVRACFNRSNLLTNIIVFKLIINMRVQSLLGKDQIEAQWFSDWLLRIGEGTEKTYTDPTTGLSD